MEKPLNAVKPANQYSFKLLTNWVLWYLVWQGRRENIGTLLWDFPLIEVVLKIPHDLEEYSNNYDIIKYHMNKFECICHSQHPTDGGSKLISFMKYTYITKAAIKYIKWAVILVICHVIHKILHFHFHWVAIIVFSTFKPLVTIFLG